MLPQPLLAQLRNVLADLYGDADSARRVVEDAGIDDRRIDFTAALLNIWRDILSEAEKTPTHLEQLFDLVQQEYGANPAWAAAYAAYHTTQIHPDRAEALLRDYLERIVAAAANLVLPLREGPLTVALTKQYIPPDTLGLTVRDTETPADAAGARQSALRFVNENSAAVLLGEEGAGKTIFANFLALCLAGERLRPSAIHLTHLGSEWTHGALWPIHIVARTLIPWLDLRAERNGDDLLWMQIIEDAGPYRHALAHWLAQRLTQDGGILILDGLDELPETQGRQAKLRQALLAFRQRFPGVRIVLTSRTYTYQQPQWQLPGFATAVLAPFSAAQIAAYLKRWQPPLDAVLPEILALHELGIGPFVLMLISVLSTGRQGALPTSPAQLLAEIIAVLFERWESARLREQVAALQTTPASQIRALLERLAYTLQAQGEAGQTGVDIDEIGLITLLLQANPDLDLRPRRIVQYICTWTRLLVERSGGLYTFAHRAFQEYLAACYLCRHPATITEWSTQLYQSPEHWRKVALWVGRMLASADRPAFAAFVQHIYPVNPPGTVAPAWLTLLAGQLVVETNFMAQPALDPKQAALVDRVRQGAVDLLVQDQLAVLDAVATGNLLGSLGDPRPGVGLDPVRQLPALDWVTVEPGAFLTGSEPPFALCQQIQQPFAISRYPITVAQYGAFVAAGGYQQRQWWTADGWRWRRTAKADGPEINSATRQTPNHPQVGVTWYEAVAFCRWLAVQLGQTISLPGELQWELAARSTDGRTYPWGNHFEAVRCNARPTGLGGTSAVGSFGRGVAPSGVADMAGNVWEWCRTLWVSQLADYTAALDGDLEANGRRALRGGSFDNEARFVRCANRHRNHPDHRASNLGFRVVREE